MSMMVMRFHPRRESFFIFIASLCLLGFTVPVASAATYYVDATNGADIRATGTLTNGPTWTTGHVGNAISFDGVNDYVDVGGNATNLNPSQWTVSVWTYALSGAGNYRGIFVPTYADGYNGGFLLLIDQAGRVALRYGNGTSYAGSINNGTSILNGWHHVVATFDGTTISLYVDNVLKNSINASTFAYRTIATPARIGYGSGTATFDGKLDELRFYNRPLTTGEISTLYADGDVPSGLILAMPFEEGNGVTTADVSGGNSGLSPSTPWKTIAAVNTTTFFQPGDSVLFKKGEVWHESLTIPSSGSPGNPITFGAYGSGNSPIIDGTTLATGWSKYAGNIYVANVAASVARVFVDNTFITPAHYPDSGYISITSDSADKISLTSTNLNPPNPDIVGAHIYIRSVPWRIEDRTITAYDATAHTFGWVGATDYDIRTNYGFYLTNKLWMLDQPGEWYYDSVAGKLYLWMMDGSDPSTHTVAVATPTSVGVIANGKNNFTLQDITIQNTGSDGVHLTNVTNAIVQRLTVAFAGQDGVLVDGTGSAVNVIGTTIRNAFGTGINFSGILNSVISDNIISDTGNFGLPAKALAGIYLWATDALQILRNTISNSGYIGIFFYGNNTTVENNAVSRSCLVLDDCGGIYTGGTAWTGNKILNNAVSDSMGNYAGTAYTYTQAEGVYLDDNANQVTVSGNTIRNADHGVYIHNGYFNTVTGNTTYLSRRSGLWIKEDTNAHAGAGTTQNNTITGNIFLNNPTNAYASVGFEGVLGSVNFGTYDGNHLISTYSGYPVSQSIFSAASVYSLPDWRTVSGQDAHSVDLGSFFSVVASTILSYLGGNFITNSTFDSTITDWSKYSSDNSAVSGWVSSCGLDGGCLHASTTNPVSSLIVSPTFALQAGTVYKVSFSVISAAPNSLSAIVRQASTPYTSYATNVVPMNTVRKDVSFIFTAPTTLSNARIDFQTSIADYALDNVVVRPIALVTHDPSNDIVLYTNPTTNSVTIDLGGQKYCDIDNHAVTGSFTLTPFASKVLLNCFNNNDLTCNNHETHDSAPLECTDPSQKGSSAWLDAPAVSTTNTGVSGYHSFDVSTPVSIPVSNVTLAVAPAATPISPKQSATPPVTAISPSFTHNLAFRDTGGAVKVLQKFLNTHGFKLASVGPGSSGNETGYFGLATYAALVRYQTSQNLPATGYFGPMTRMKAVW